MSNAGNIFPSYRFLVSLAGATGPERALGGFSEATGLSAAPLKIPGSHKTGDVTLKRGVVASSIFFGWLAQARNRNPAAASSLIVTVRDTANRPVEAWKLNNAFPSKYTGPAFNAQGNDVAIEELVLSPESLEIWPPWRHD